MSKYMTIKITDLPKEGCCNVKVEVSHNMDKQTAQDMVDSVCAELRNITKDKFKKLPIRERDTA